MVLIIIGKTLEPLGRYLLLVLLQWGLASQN